MKRGLAPASAGLLLVGGALLFVPACADNESSLFVRSALIPTEKCEVTGGPAALANLHGRLDVSLFTQYSAALNVGNQVVQRGDDTKLRSETSRVELYAADVTIEDSRAQKLTSYSVPTSGFIDSAAGSDPGYGVADVLLIDAATADVLRAKIKDASPPVVLEVTTTVIVRGRTLGGNEVETAPWSFPVSVCYGCAVTGDCSGVTPAPDGLNCRACSLFVDRGLDCHCLSQ